MYGVQELHLCLFFSSSAEVILTSFTSSAFSVHSPLSYQLTFFCTYSIHSLNIHQYHMIYHNHTNNY